MRQLVRALSLCVVSFCLFYGLAAEQSEEQYPQWPASIIKRFVDPLTRQENRSLRSMLASDQEHASSIGPVLTPGSPVYMRIYQVQNQTPDQQNLVLEDGRVFMNYDDPYDLSKMPVLKIRPIDGKTRIPFLVRARFEITADASDQAAVYLFVRMPSIFSPRFDLRRVYINGRKVEAQVTTGSEDGSFTVFVPLEEVDGKVTAGRSFDLVMDGSVTLGDYQTLSPGGFESAVVYNQPALKNVARVLPGRDYLGPAELALLQKLTVQLRAEAKTQYDQVVATQRLVSDRLSYYQNNMQRTAMQAYVEGLGDCDDYSRLMVCLLRSLGIPSRMAIGYLYDFNNMGTHAWVEAALETKGHDTHWFICDPTLASASQDKAYFVQFKNRIYLYPIRFDLKTQNLASDQTTEVFMNWSEKEKFEKLPPSALSAIVRTFDETLDTSFKERVTELATQGLELPRQFMFAPGAGYVVADHPITPGRSHLQLTLDSEERVSAELTVLDDDYGLESPADLQVAGLLKDAYQNLRQTPFEGSEARYCLELSYLRDRYSDRLQRVRLRVSRYLVENYLRPIVNSFRKATLLTDEEAQKVLALHDASAGKNLYYLQELARRLAPPVAKPAPAPAAPPPDAAPASNPPES
jgi:hypothetical protein